MTIGVTVSFGGAIKILDELVDARCTESGLKSHGRSTTATLLLAINIFRFLVFHLAHLFQELFRLLG